MSQDAQQIKPGYPLFTQPEYQELFARKKEFEEGPTPEKMDEVFQWTTTEEYKELNFNRKVLTVNPAKACQPLGALLCALGFKNALPYIHGSQGCAAYFRTYFNRHFREPVAAVSDSMTEDAAVFGGQKNLFDGTENAIAMYKPDMLVVFTTCMAEVIGDDLNAFINNARAEGKIPDSMPTPFAHTPSFVGSHVDGWDNMLEGILRYFTFKSIEDKKGMEERVVGSNGKINIAMGFDTYLGNIRMIKRMLREMGVAFTMLSDVEEILDMPANGEFKMYANGTTPEDIKDAPNAIDTLFLQPMQSTKSRKFVREVWNQPGVEIDIPMGLAGTDAFLMKVSEITGKPIPESLEIERGRLVDMITDSHQWLHGKRFSLYGDPDFLMGMCRFLLELGAEPVHVLANNAGKKWVKAITQLLKSSPYGQQSEVYAGKDLWHLRSLVFTNKPDFLIGNSYGKYIQRDTLYKGKEYEVPLIRIGFPIFDRHHLHRETTWGYEGAMYLLKTLVNAVMEKLDQDTMQLGKTDFAFDLVR